MKNLHRFLQKLLPAALVLAGSSLRAGPYSAALNDPTNPYDAPVPGFVGPDGEGKAPQDNGFGDVSNARNFVNPLFFGWASDWSGYVRSDAQTSYSDPSLALGAVTGDLFDVVSMGDLTSAKITNGNPVGTLTLHFTNAVQTQPIRNLPGADLVVFENGLISVNNTGGVGIGGVFAELAYVEVSSDGVNFARFPSITQTLTAVSAFGSMDPTKIYNLAGKHVNGNGESWGTPFDLAALVNEPAVVAETVNLNQIRYVRVVDIPGKGTFFDSLAHAIFDPWMTTGSGGLDLEAIGAISVCKTFDEWQDMNGLMGEARGAQADADGDGVANLLEYAFGMRPTRSDAELLPKAEMVSGGLTVALRRDLRAIGVVVEVLGTDDLKQPWQVIARGEPGAEVLPVAPYAPTIEDGSASPIASVGVVRRVRVSAMGGQRYLRVCVSPAP